MTVSANELLDSIDGDLQGLLPPHPAGKGNPAQVAPATPDKMYEVFLLMRWAVAAVHAGWHLELREEGTGSPARYLRFRGSPGCIYNSGHKASRFTYLRLSNSNRGEVVRLYVGVKVMGFSGETHEADVLAVSEKLAKICVHDRRHPPGRSVLMHVEGKFYARDVSMRTAREFVVIACDLEARASLLACPRLQGKALRFANKTPLRDVVALGDVLPVCVCVGPLGRAAIEAWAYRRW